MIFVNVRKKTLKRDYNFTYKHFSVVGFPISKIIKAEDKLYEITKCLNERIMQSRVKRKVV